MSRLGPGWWIVPAFGLGVAVWARAALILAPVVARILESLS